MNLNHVFQSSAVQTLLLTGTVGAFIVLGYWSANAQAPSDMPTEDALIPAEVATQPPSADLEAPNETDESEALSFDAEEVEGDAATSPITSLHVYGDETTGKVYSTFWQGSLMFRNKDVKNLLAIYQHYKNNKKTAEARATTPEDSLAGLLPQQTDAPIEEEFLEFTVGSLIYQSPQRWSAWINGQRYSGEDLTQGFVINNSRLSVVDASSEEVTFLWMPNPNSFAFLEERWEDKQNAESEGNQSPQQVHNERLTFDKESQTFSITMSPNQTFISRIMSVLEGTRESQYNGSLNNILGILNETDENAEDPLNALGIETGEESDAAPDEGDGSLAIEATPPGQDPTRAIAEGLIEHYETTLPQLHKNLNSNGQSE